jgi:hypothetical protein
LISYQLLVKAAKSSYFECAVAAIMSAAQRQHVVKLARGGLLSRGDAQMAELWTSDDPLGGIIVLGPVFGKDDGGISYWEFTLVGADGEQYVGGLRVPREFPTLLPLLVSSERATKPLLDLAAHVVAIERRLAGVEDPGAPIEPALEGETLELDVLLPRVRADVSTGGVLLLLRDRFRSSQEALHAAPSEQLPPEAPAARPPARPAPGTPPPARRQDDARSPTAASPPARAAPPAASPAAAAPREEADAGLGEGDGEGAGGGADRPDADAPPCVAVGSAASVPGATTGVGPEAAAAAAAEAEVIAAVVARLRAEGVGCRVVHARDAGASGGGAGGGEAEGRGADSAAGWEWGGAWVMVVVGHGAALAGAVARLTARLPPAGCGDAHVVPVCLGARPAPPGSALARLAPAGVAAPPPPSY